MVGLRVLGEGLGLNPDPGVELEGLRIRVYSNQGLRTKTKDLGQKPRT